MAMRTRSVANLVRKYFTAFRAHDRKRMEALLSEDFTFSSPRDDHIGKEAYFATCWPKDNEFRAFRIEKIFEVSQEAFVLYSCKPQKGAKFRNTEHFRIRRGRIREIDVYFGRNLPDADAEHDPLGYRQSPRTPRAQSAPSATQ